ncbi:MAG: diguanylate cyclase [Deltaproteobacteria bacterium]|nr:diguanylate cyclase [Deltaproteobacteria bacterium]
MVHKPQKTLTTIVAGVLVAITLTSNIALFFFVYKDVHKQVKKNLSAKTLSTLYAVAPVIDLVKYSGLVSTKDSKDPYYETLRKYLEFVRQKGNFRYLYTIAEDQKGKLIYVVDGYDPNDEGFSRLGDITTDDETPGFRKVKQSLKPVMEVSDSEKWGKMMTVYIPLMDPSGKLVGVLCADHEMSAVTNAINHRSRFFGFLITIITILGLTATILSSFIIRRTEQSRLETHHNLQQSYRELDESQKALKASEETKRVLLNAATESILLMDASGKIQDANTAMAAQWKLTPHEIRGKSLFDLSGDESNELMTHRNEVLESRMVEHFERDEGDRHLTYSLYPVGEETYVSSVAVFSQDISWRRKLENALKESEERFRSAFENAAVGIALTDINGKLIKVNRSFCEMLELGEGQAIGESLDAITHPEDKDKDVTLKERLLAGEISYYHVEKRYIGTSGKTLWGILSASVVAGEDGKPLYAIGMIQDITQRKLVEYELKLAKMDAETARENAEFLARTDFLTQLLNRRAFMERFDSEISRASRESRPIGIIIADIDHFKKVNDTWGHESGDRVLKAFAQALERNCRKYDFVGRHGGEEFIVCLPESNMEQTIHIAERIRQNVEDMCTPIGDGSHELKITASFGATVMFPGRGDTSDSTIIRADHALYDAKTKGRNRVCSMETDPDQHIPL